LNGDSHNRSDRKERDMYIKGMLDSSQIPFYPCPVNMVSYQQDIEKIKNIMQGKISE